ncbi:MAG: hypothetical protein ACRDU4_06025 [Mycobacterium sp.]
MSTKLTAAQCGRLHTLCGAYQVEFDETDYLPAFDLPPGWVSGWVGGARNAWLTLFVGVSPEGQAHPVSATPKG